MIYIFVVVVRCPGLRLRRRRTHLILDGYCTGRLRTRSVRPIWRTRIIVGVKCAGRGYARRIGPRWCTHLILHRHRTSRLCSWCNRLRIKRTGPIINRCWARLRPGSSTWVLLWIERTHVILDGIGRIRGRGILRFRRCPSFVCWRFMACFEQLFEHVGVPFLRWG